MASFNKVTAVSSSVKTLKVKDFLKGEDYDGAAIEYFGKVLDGFKANDESAERLQKALKAVCDGHKKTGKDGNNYVDAYFGRKSRQVLGAIYGDGNFGGVLYQIAAAFEPAKQNAWLVTEWAKAVPAGTVVKAKKAK